MTDLALFKPRLGTAALTPVLFTDVKLVEGVELLSQQFIALLLREYDAVFNRGTALMAQVRGGGISGVAMNIMVNLAVTQAVQQMPVGVTPDETLAGVRVVSVSKSGDRLSIALEITAQSAASKTTTTTVRTA